MGERASEEAAVAAEEGTGQLGGKDFDRSAGQWPSRLADRERMI